MKYLDLTGRRVNRLTVLRRVDNVGRQPAWLCRCDCGTEKRVLGMYLRANQPVDCGCELAQRRRAAKVTHGMTKSPEFSIWSRMRARCNSPRDPVYKHYGGRGITVAPEWGSFAQFYADMGSRPSAQHSLDRINNNGPYSPGNCRWALPHEQQNNRRSNVLVTREGKTMTLKQWATHYGVPYAVVKERRAAGWAEETWFSPSPRRKYGALITYNGDSLTMTEWAAKLQAPYITVWQRVHLAGKNPDGTSRP